MVRGFKNTGKTMESRTIANIRAMGIKNRKDAVLAAHDVASNPYIYDGRSDESKDMAKNLLKPIKDQIEAIVGNPEYATRLKNTMERTAAGPNPELMQQAMQNTLREIAADAAKKAHPSKIENGVDQNASKRESYQASLEGELLGDQSLQTLCNHYADFANKKQIYTQMVKAQDFGISMDAYVQDIAENFVETETTSDRIERYSRYSEENIEAEIEDLSTHQLEEITEEIVSSVDEITKKIEELNSSAEEETRRQYEEQLEELRKIESTLVSKILTERQRAYSDAERKLMEQVRDSCEKEIDVFLKELKVESKEDNYLEVARVRAGIPEEDNIDAVVSRLSTNLEAKRSGWLPESDKRTEKEIRDSLTKARTYQKIKANNATINSINKNLNQ